ncbi:MAG: hypothetical protein JNL97_10190 [Verrucomicrobiales bacterium]|nr:hypothetical protein [Verrucomicrobiales bacterium]
MSSPSSTLVAGLSLSLRPTSVFAGSTATLKLVIAVPDDGAPVVLGGLDALRIRFPSARSGMGPGLVTDLTGVGASIASMPHDCPWNVTGPQSAEFTTYPVTPTTLMPGDSVVIEFDSLPIVAETGSPEVLVDVEVGSTRRPGFPLPVQVVAPQAGVIAWVDRPVLGLNETTTLRWTSQGGTTVRVVGFTTQAVPSGYRDFPVGGASSTPLAPSADAGPVSSEHNYTVQLIAQPGDKVLAETQVACYLHRPFVAEYGILERGNVVPAITIDYGQKVTLRWRCRYVDPEQGIGLSFMGLRGLPDSTTTLSPETALPFNQDQIVITLTAPGFGAPATADATVNFRPIQILYFKYLALTPVEGRPPILSNAQFRTLPANIPGSQVSTVPGSPGTLRLTVTGPGGTQTRYLGTEDEPYLEIRYFAPDNPVQSGQPFHLRWLTHRATRLTLRTPQGDQPITAENIADGTSQPLTVTEPTTYVLTAVGNDGGILTSTLLVTPS